MPSLRLRIQVSLLLLSISDHFSITSLVVHRTSPTYSSVYPFAIKPSSFRSITKMRFRFRTFYFNPSGLLGFFFSYSPFFLSINVVFLTLDVFILYPCTCVVAPRTYLDTRQGVPTRETCSPHN